MQIEVFPQRLLNVGTAQKLLNELNTIEGIIRMVVYGPGLPRDDPDDLLEGKFGVAEKRNGSWNTRAVRWAGAATSPSVKSMPPG